MAKKTKQEPPSPDGDDMQNTQQTPKKGVFTIHAGVMRTPEELEQWLNVKNPSPPKANVDLGDDPKLQIYKHIKDKEE